MPSQDPPPSTLRRRVFGLVLRACVLAAALVFLVRGVQWKDVSGAAKGAGFALPVLVALLNGCMMSIKALRLRTLIRQKKVSFGTCFTAMLTASAINNVTPFRGGDVARLWMLERAGGVTKVAAVAIATIENLVDITLLAALGFLASLALSGQRWATVAAPFVFAGGLVVMVLLRATARRAAAQSDAPTQGTQGSSRGIGARIRLVLRRLEPGFRALSEPGAATRTLLLTLLSWTCESVMVILCARALGISVSPALALVVLLGINLAMALPATPASAGPYESAAAAVLVLAGVAKGPAIAFAILYHALQLVPVTVVGLSVLFILKRRQGKAAEFSQSDRACTPGERGQPAQMRDRPCRGNEASVNLITNSNHYTVGASE